MTVDYMLEVRRRGQNRREGCEARPAPMGKPADAAGNPRFMAFISGRGEVRRGEERLMDVKSATFKCAASVVCGLRDAREEDGVAVSTTIASAFNNDAPCSPRCIKASF